MDGNQLRRLVNKAAKTYTDQYRLPHYLSRNQTEPTVLFFPDQDALLHGIRVGQPVLPAHPQRARRIPPRLPIQAHLRCAARRPYLSCGLIPPVFG